MKKILLLLMSMYGPMTVNAQQAEGELEKLRFLIADWSIENLTYTEEKGWSSIGNTKSTIRWEHGERFINENAKHLSAFGEINMITYIGFDSRVKRYKLTAMDKEYGLMDIYYGAWEDGNLVFTNLESDVPIRTGDGKELSFRLTYANIRNSAFDFLVEGTYDKGLKWFPFAKGKYSK